MYAYGRALLCAGPSRWDDSTLKDEKWRSKMLGVEGEFLSFGRRREAAVSPL